MYVFKCIYSVYIHTCIYTYIYINHIKRMTHCWTLRHKFSHSKPAKKQTPSNGYKDIIASHIFTSAHTYSNITPPLSSPLNTNDNKIPFSSHLCTIKKKLGVQSRAMWHWLREWETERENKQTSRYFTNVYHKRINTKGHREITI